MNSAQLLVVVAVFCGHLRLTRSASICCPGLRCYSNDPPFQWWPLPQCPEEMCIKMTLYTRRNPTEGQPINRTFIPSVFKGTSMTMFVVHGWLHNEEYQWMHDLKDAALTREDFNVIIVGWRCGAAQNYLQSASNTRTVGGAIALVANNMINQGGSSQSKLYCVGHSLGGHVCGHAGQHLKFGRITGLDPAGPLFEDRDWSVGLNPSCADLVDVIHTDGKTLIGLPLGMMKRLGHVDLYPNGGNNQPGCILDPHVDIKRLLSLENFIKMENGTLTVNVDLAILCSHIRAYVYFIEALRDPCFLSHYTCPTVSSVLNPKLFCEWTQDPVQSLGFAVNEFSSRGTFYLETNSASPFCKR